MRILIMTNERKEQLLDQILELMTAVAYRKGGDADRQGMYRAY